MKCKELPNDTRAAAELVLHLKVTVAALDANPSAASMQLNRHWSERLTRHERPRETNEVARIVAKLPPASENQDYVFVFVS